MATTPWMRRMAAALADAERERDELAAKLALPCPDCGNDRRVGEIGRALGFRPDLLAREVMRLRAEVEALREDRKRLQAITRWYAEGKPPTDEEAVTNFKRFLQEVGSAPTK